MAVRRRHPVLASSLLEALFGVKHSRRRKINGVINVLDRADNDITYFYASRLPGEAAAVEDIHFHPVGPSTVRVAVTARF